MKQEMACFSRMILMGSLLLTLCGCISSNGRKSFAPAISNFNLERYMGTWYEIARLPQWFERNLDEVKAEYTLLENGTVKVVNTGVSNGNIQKKEGVARLKYLKSFGDLEVSFFPPFYGDYRVIRVADDYRYAVVTSKTKDALWILSRTPQMSQKDLDELLAFAASYDYDVSKLEYPRQPEKP